MIEDDFKSFMTEMTRDKDVIVKYGPYSNKTFTNFSTNDFYNFLDFIHSLYMWRSINLKVINSKGTTEYPASMIRYNMKLYIKKHISLK